MAAVSKWTFFRLKSWSGKLRLILESQSQLSVSSSALCVSLGAKPSASQCKGPLHDKTPEVVSNGGAIESH